MTILNTISITTYPWILNLWLALAVVLVIGGIIWGIESAGDGDSILLCVACIMLVSGVFGMIHSIQQMDKQATFDYNKYQVTLDETILAKDFLNQYEVLSREGEIFTIKEIEVDEE